MHAPYVNASRRGTASCPLRQPLPGTLIYGRMGSAPLPKKVPGAGCAAFPKPKYLQILIDWLGVSLDANILTPEKRVFDAHAIDLEHGPGYITPMNPGQERLARLFISLNPEQQKAVMELIETCFLNKSGGGKDLTCSKCCSELVYLGA